MEEIYITHPIYSEGVRVTGWDFRRQAYPFDICPAPGKAHYCTFGLGQTFYVTKSTTHESMENGITNVALNKTWQQKMTRRPMTNFTSFPSFNTPERFASVEKQPTDCDFARPKNSSKQNISTYTRNYVDHMKGWFKEPPIVPDIREVCPLMNRIPVNELELVGPIAPYKFMDDHLFMVSPERKLINSYRQIRMVTYNPWLVTYR